MKEIGDKLRETRENMGISLEEASEDLKTTKDQLSNIETGSMEAFSDVFYLKCLIKDYAKYLGLDKENVVDDFNEFLFDFTSKISVEDIKNAKNKEEEKKDIISSPYTELPVKKINKKNILIVSAILLVILIIIIIILVIGSGNNNIDNVISYKI